MKKFRDVVGEIMYEDLVKIRKDLETGGHHIKKLVDSQIQEIEKKEVKKCATCGAELNPYYVDDYTLTFGRRDFRKRAYFCGLDCLNYFLEKLKRQDLKE